MNRRSSAPVRARLSSCPSPVQRVGEPGSGKPVLLARAAPSSEVCGTITEWTKPARWTASRSHTQSGLSPQEAQADHESRGRLAESAVGAQLANAAAAGACELFYWRERNREVDFVVRVGRTVVAIEVKSGRAPNAFSGLAAFAEASSPAAR